MKPTNPQEDPEVTDRALKYEIIAPGRPPWRTNSLASATARLTYLMQELSGQYSLCEEEREDGSWSFRFVKEPT